MGPSAGTFWDVSSIRGTTINFIDTPVIGGVPFLIPLYVLLALITAVIFLIARRNRAQVGGYAVARALIPAFAAAALLFALRMDYGWYKMWQLDRKGPPPGSLDRGMAEDLRTAYAFVLDFKKTLPTSEKVRILTDDMYDRMVLKYYLLPIKVSGAANCIVVFSDNHVVFDPARNILLEDGTVVEKNVAPVASYEGRFFVFHREKD